MAIIRSDGDSFSYYYGSTFNESSPLSLNQMQLNATYIFGYLRSKGWAITSICALLGNMQAESTINPGRWQNDLPGSTSSGYGLVQWTPSTKYTEWAIQNGFTDPSTMSSNLARIVYEVENNIQWIMTDSYFITFKAFARGYTIEDIPYTLKFLTEAFLINYERPADQSNSVKEYRTSLANYWYEYLSGTTPSQPSKRKKKKYNFWILNVRKRREEWIKQP